MCNIIQKLNLKSIYKLLYFQPKNFFKNLQTQLHFSGGCGFKVVVVGVGSSISFSNVVITLTASITP
jgi:hypothetical protein